MDEKHLTMALVLIAIIAGPFIAAAIMQKIFPQGDDDEKKRKPSPPGKSGSEPDFPKELIK